MAFAAGNVIGWEDWRGVVADHWSEATLTIARLPEDENTHDEAIRVRDRLCRPHWTDDRAAGPPLSRTFCAAVNETGDGQALVHALAQASERGGDIEAARAGQDAPSFFGALSGVRVPDGLSFERWIDSCLRAVRPRGAGPRHKGRLHLLLLVTHPGPVTSGPPPAEDARIVRPMYPHPADVEPWIEHSVSQLWPSAAGEEAGYLALGLRDMSCGRRADLDSAVDALRDRLPLAAVREGLAVRWEPTDLPVRRAAEALDALGVTTTSGQIRAPASMRDAELTARLWSAGLWTPPAQDWQQGLTSRAWAALAGDLPPLRLESAAVETLRRCLVVERLCRRQLLAWLEVPLRASAVVHALHDIPTSTRQRLPLAAVIEAQSAARFSDEAPEDADLIRAATFGQIVMLLERVCKPPSDLTDALWGLVRARNSAAHGQCPTLAQFRMMLRDDRTALRGLRRLTSV